SKGSSASRSTSAAAATGSEATKSKGLATGPSSFTSIEQTIGLRWPPGARRVLEQGARGGRTPGCQHVVDVAPARLHLVRAQKQGRVADQGIEQQALIGGRRLGSEVLLVVEVEGGRCHHHGAARLLHAEGQVDGLVGLDADGEHVWADLAELPIAQH